MNHKSHKLKSETLFNLLFKGNESINLYDVGAEGGPNPIWDYKFINCIGFEPDAEEFLRLQKRNKPNEMYYNVALGSRIERSKINVCRKPNCSSIFKPNKDYLSEFENPSRFDIVNEYECDFTTLDKIIEVDSRNPDIIKLDTQGSELDILNGALDSLKNTLFIEIETEFNYFYNDQPTFAEVHLFMLEKGFRLFDLNKAYFEKKVDLKFKNSKSELVFSNSLYFRDIANLDFNDPVNLIMSKKQIWIAFNLGFYNYSYFLLLKIQNHIGKNQFDLINDFFVKFSEFTFKNKLTNKRRILNLLKRMIKI